MSSCLGCQVSRGDILAVPMRIITAFSVAASNRRHCFTICAAVAKTSILRTLLLFAFATSVFSQQKPQDEAAGTSTVSGHVFCADTNAPARMATVVLVPAEAIDTWPPGERNRISTHGEGVQTLLDGSFSMQHVAPGAYYVIGSQLGYISPLSSMSAAESAHISPDNTADKKLPIHAPKITVQSNLPVSVNVTMERGAAVTGTVRFDDGSPAIGLQVTALMRWKDEWTPIPYLPFGNTPTTVQTDDQGNYRISGLPTQDYLLEVQLNLSKTSYDVNGDGGSGTSSSGVYSLTIYSGAKARPKDAVPFTLTPGEQRHGEDLEIPISKLHTVRGSLIAARDGHVLNGGELFLLYSDDKSKANHVTVEEDEDGFTFSFVPEGDYILQVSGAADNEYEEIPNPPHSSPPTRTETHTLRTYSPAERPLHVDNDLTGVVVSVPDLPKQRTAQPQQP